MVSIRIQCFYVNLFLRTTSRRLQLTSTTLPGNPSSSASHKLYSSTTAPQVTENDVPVRAEKREGVRHGQQIITSRPVGIKATSDKDTTPTITGPKREGQDMFRTPSSSSSARKDELDIRSTSSDEVSRTKSTRRTPSQITLSSSLSPPEKKRRRIDRSTVNEERTAPRNMILNSNNLTINVPVVKKRPKHRSLARVASKIMTWKTLVNHVMSFHISGVFSNVMRLSIIISISKVKPIAGLLPEKLSVKAQQETQSGRIVRQRNVTKQQEAYQSELLAIREILYHPGCGLFTPTPFDFARRYSPPYTTERAKAFYEKAKRYSNGLSTDGFSKSSKWTTKFGRLVQDLVQSRASESHSKPAVRDLEKKLSRNHRMIRNHLSDVQSISTVTSYLKYCHALYYQANQDDDLEPHSSFQEIVQRFDIRLSTHRNNLTHLERLRKDMDNQFIKHGLQPCIEYIYSTILRKTSEEYAEGILEIIRHPTHGIHASRPFNSNSDPMPPYKTMLGRSVGSLLKGDWSQTGGSLQNALYTTRLQSVLRTMDSRKLAPVYVPTNLANSVRSTKVNVNQLSDDIPKRMTVKVDKSAVKHKQNKKWQSETDAQSPTRSD